MTDKVKGKISKKVAALVGAGLLVLGAGVAGAGVLANNANQKVITDQAAQITALENAEPITVEVPVEVQVEVDNGKLDLVLNHIFDADGKVSYLTDGLDDDEVALIADRIVFVNEIKALAEAEIKSELADALEDYHGEWIVTTEAVAELTHRHDGLGLHTHPAIAEVGHYTYDFDEDEISKIKIGNHAGDNVVTIVDFDDEDATVIVKGTFYDDESNKKYKYTAKITFEDGEADDITVTDVQIA